MSRAKPPAPGISINISKADFFLEAYKMYLDPDFVRNARTDVIPGFHVVSLMGMGWFGCKSEILPLVQTLAKTRSNADANALEAGVVALRPVLDSYAGRGDMSVGRDGTVFSMTGPAGDEDAAAAVPAPRWTIPKSKFRPR